MSAKKTKTGTTKKSKDAKAKKLSAIDAAAQVLASAKAPMNAKELIEAMSAKGLWTSPGGKTPHATLFSAIIREISVKGKESRFVKAERGKFAAK
jgi:HB1/ASXL restriction endonuclease-like protein with HTH domain